jgi:hypothetical protein
MSESHHITSEREREREREPEREGEINFVIFEGS